MLECQILTVPSSDPETMMGSEGWKMAKDTLDVCPSRTWMHDLEW